VNLGQVRAEENALWSLTSHDISVAMYLLGQVPKEVQANGKYYLRKAIQDVVFLTLNFKNNVMAHIHASWLDPHKIRKFTIVGSKRMAVFDDMESAEKIRIYDKGFDWLKNSGTYDSFLTLREGDIHIPRIDMIEPLRLECRHFIDCIRKNSRPFTDGDNGLSALKVLNAAQQSLEKNGKVIKI
jgi:predicted dehydrogenase